LVRGPGVVVEDEAHACDLASSAGDRLAGVAALELRELLGVVPDEGGQLRERSAALGGGPAGPALRGLEGRRRGLARPVDGARAGEGRRTARRAGRRIHDAERLAVGGVYGLAADDHAQGRKVGCGTARRGLLDRHGIPLDWGAVAGAAAFDLALGMSGDHT